MNHQINSNWGVFRKKKKLIYITKIFKAKTTMYGWGSVPNGSSYDKQSACNARDLSSIPGSGRAPGERNGYPFQYSCLEISMDRGAWQATVHRGHKESDTTELITLSLSKRHKNTNIIHVPGEHQTVRDFFWRGAGLQNHCRWTVTMKLKDTCSLGKKLLPT